MRDSLLLWLLGLPLITSPLVYLAGRIVHHSVVARWLGLTGLIAVWAIFTQVVRSVSQNGALETYVGMAALRVDDLSLPFIVLALLLGTLAMLYSFTYMTGEVGEEKYYALLAVMIGAMIGVASAADLFNLWVWFEAMVVSSYLLVTFYRQQPASLEAGVKYVIQSMIGSALAVLGVALVLLQMGTLNLSEIHATQPAPALSVAGALFIIGFGVKIAFVPLHTWLPDAHAQAPSGVSALLSGVVIETGLIALLRALGALAGISLSWGVLLMGFGAVNMLAGNLFALRQKEIKRLLAYSSLTHVGYMLLGLGMAIYSGQPDGAQAGFFHMITHGLMKGLAFLAAGAFLYTLHIANGNHDPLTIADLSGMSRRYPFAALMFSLAVLGLGGIPPLAGFMSKLQIFAAGFTSHDVIIKVLVVFAVFNSLLSLAYYLPLITTLYFEQASNQGQQKHPLSFTMRVPLMILGMGVVVIGIVPGLVSWLTEPAGAAIATLFGH